MKYYVTEMYQNDGSEEVLLVTEDKDLAIKEARDMRYINKRDKNKCTIEIRVYVNDIEGEDCTCFDYDTVEF